jgi:hypothetical protein
MMKGYVAVPVRLPTGELTGHIGITEDKVPKEFHLSRVVRFPKKTCLGRRSSRKCEDLFFYLRTPNMRPAAF